MNVKLGLCWGVIGHRCTAAIAKNYLSTNAANNIQKILQTYPGTNGLPFASIVELSTYADDFRPQNPWSSAFHYINMAPPIIDYDEATQCPEPAYCITKALQNYTAILKDKSLTHSQKGQALAFVVHLIGDIAQPLHVGNPSDAGGNGISMTLQSTWQTSSKSVNLHSCWDTSFLQHWMNTEGIPNDYDYAYLKFLTYVESDQTFKNQYLNKLPDILQMTRDTRIICLNKVYGPLSQYNLASVPISYYTASWPTVKEQIMKSGLQMAALLNDIFNYPASSEIDEDQIEVGFFSKIFSFFKNIF